MCWLTKLFRKPNTLTAPTMSKEEVIEKLLEDSLLHEHWAAIVTEHPSYSRYFGDYDWHVEWAEIFKQAAWLLKPSLSNASMPVSYVIEKLNEAIDIHEGWAAYVTQYPSYSTSFGDYDFHMGWIEVYKNAIYYLSEKSLSRKEVHMNRNKLKSRKFWTALVSEIVGVVALIWGASVADKVSTIAGAVILIASTLGYLKAEGDIDKENAKRG